MTDLRLKVAIQKSGRLTDLSVDLFSRCGLVFTRGKDELVGFGENMPLDLMFVRDDDIPDLVGQQVCDFGVVGMNVVTEHQLGVAERGGTSDLVVHRELDFGRCRLAIAVPDQSEIQSVSQLSGLRIATTYPNTLRQWLVGQGIDSEVVTLSGAVELAPRLGRADAICDLVSTGSTLTANRLRELQTILVSQAALVGWQGMVEGPKSEWAKRMIQRIDGVQQVRGSKYVMLHAPRSALNEICALLPGSESPTIIPLEGAPDKVAVHAVCREMVFWETLERLRDAGASSLLVLPVEKMLA